VAAVVPHWSPHPDGQRCFADPFLCFTPTYASWANPTEAQFGPLRTSVIAGSNHPNHTVLARKLHAYLRWRNASAATPTYWPPNAANAPASAANKNAAGANPLLEQPDRNTPKRSWSWP
jgi:hypothetical protein